MEIRLANGKGVAVVDDEDADLVQRHSWHRHSEGYAACRSGGRIVLLHRLVMGLEYGDRRQVDHRNLDRLDCRRANLRVVTPGQNMQNLAAREGCSSRHRGVSFCKQTGKWRAVAGLDGRFHHIGRFDSEDEAAVAVAEWRSANMPFALA